MSALCAARVRSTAPNPLLFKYKRSSSSTPFPFVFSHHFPSPNLCKYNAIFFRDDSRVLIPNWKSVNFEIERFLGGLFSEVLLQRNNIEMKGELQQEQSVAQNPGDSDPLLENQHAVDSPSPSCSSETKNEDIEAGSVACCRICLECDGEEDDELISPCMCKGTQQFVHRSCLDHWRSVKEGFAFSHCTTCKAQFHLQVTEFEDNTWRKIKFRLFVARDVFLVFLAVQTVIAAMGGFAYVMDRDGTFRNSFNDSWDRILSKHPIPFYYCIGVLAFFVLLGFFGLVLHCSSFNSNDPCMAGCQNCCYGWGILDCFPASIEACFALVIVFVVIFATLGIAYGFLAATMAVQRIWQRHYHILAKRELTKEYIVEDLHGCYSPPILDPEHEAHLKILKLFSESAEED